MYPRTAVEAQGMSAPPSVKCAGKQLAITAFFSKPSADPEGGRKRQRTDDPAQVNHPDLHAAQGASGCCLLLDTPASWRQALVRDHLDSKDRRAWYQTCCAGLAQVMAWTPHLEFGMLLSGRRYDTPVLTRAAQQLRRHHATLHMIEVERCMCDCRDARHFNELLRRFSHTPPRHLRLFSLATTPDLYAAITATSPQLLGLHIDTLSTPLPPPSQLPALKHLGLALDNTLALPSVLSYLTQLTSLELKLEKLSAPEQQQAPARILSTPVPQLLKLTLPNTTLDDELLHLLLDHTPALQHLEVGRWQLSSDQYASRTWQLQYLKVQHGYCSDEVAQMLRVPGPPEGQRTTVAPKMSRMHVAKAHLEHSAWLLVRLNQLHLPGLEYIHLKESDAPYTAAEVSSVVSVVNTVPAKHLHLAAVPLSHATLTALAQLNGDKDVTVESAHWEVDPATPLDNLPCVQGLTSLTLPKCDLDDHTLSVLLHCSPRLKWLTVRAVRLATDANSRAVWALVTLSVEGDPVPVSVLAHLPDPREGEKTCSLHVRGELRRLLEDGGIVCDVTDPQAPATTSIPPAEQPAALNLATTLPLSDHCGHVLSRQTLDYSGRPCVCLRGWAITAGLLRVLAGLPGLFRLYLTESDWQLSPAELQAFLSQMPPNCDALSITPRPSHQQLTAIVSGAVRERQVTLTLPYEWGLKGQLVDMRQAAGVSQEQLSFSLQGGWVGADRSQEQEWRNF